MIGRATSTMSYVDQVAFDLMISKEFLRDSWTEQINKMWAPKLVRLYKMSLLASGK